MKKTLLLIIAFSMSICVFAQKKGQEDKSIQEYKEQITSMVRYLEETFTFIGNPDNTTQEKDIIFRESYLKIFSNDKVQIEDDLDANRRTSINKDVQAYLKDIDFFFQKVNFTFEIEKIDAKTNEQKETYFLVTTMRTMNGRTIVGDSISDRCKRFMEVNLDPFKKELKIASIYTKKPNETEELRNWWNKMPIAWKHYFGDNVLLYDSIDMSDLSHIYMDSIVIKRNVNDSVREITMKADMEGVYAILSNLSKISDIDISYNDNINSLEPLLDMSNITNLDCSNTGVYDITPVRNLNKIRNLNISNTNIEDISSIKYISDMVVFVADNTPTKDIEIVSNFQQLTSLSISGTQVSDIRPIVNCIQLANFDMSKTSVTTLDSVSFPSSIRMLNISNTQIDNISSLQNLENLQSVNMDFTRVSDLSPLSSLLKLGEVQCSNTKVADLMPLKDLPQLIRIYCDNSNVDVKAAQMFNNANKDVMVVFETETLKKWWDDLPYYWKSAFTKQTGIDMAPGPEQLHKLIQVKSLDVESAIQDATPIGRLTNLENLNLSDTKIIDIEPLRNLLNLKQLNIKNTKITDLGPISNLVNLQVLNIENTPVTDLSPLIEMSSIMTINAENSKITPETVFDLKVAQPQVTVIYQTEKLKSWWNNLDKNWRSVLKDIVNVDAEPKAEQLQQLADITTIEVDPNINISSLEPISQLQFVKKLVINFNQLTDLSPVAGFRLLEELSVNGNAIDNIIPLTNVSSLKSLSIENTLVTDINALSGKPNLKVLSIANTSIKNLKVLTDCTMLEELNIANTPIKTLDPVKNIGTLKHIKAFNTKIKKKEIDAFKAKYQDINIVYY